MLHSTKWLFAFAVCGALLMCVGVGCSKEKAPAEPNQAAPAEVAESAGEMPAMPAPEPAETAAEDMASAAKEVADEAADVADEQMKEAQSLLDKVMQYIKDGKLDDAEAALKKLEGMSSALPQEMQTKIADARKVLEAARKAAEAATEMMAPETMPETPKAPETPSLGG